MDPLGNADGSRGADQSAEMATYALGADNAGLSCLAVEGNGLMAAVHTRHVATSTADTLVAVYLRIDNRVAIQVVGIRKRWQRLTYKLTEFADATLSHITLKTEHQVVDDVVAILHHCGTYLYIATAQLDKLQGVAPRLDAADAA